VTDSQRRQKLTSGVPRRSSPEHARKLAAQRQQRRRQLVKAGLERYTITADDRLPDYLIQTGRLTPPPLA
jgi:hypothetical protein